MMNGFGMGFGWLFWIAVLVIVVWLVLRVINNPLNKDRNSARGTALDILKRRYASGEISKKEYDDLKKDIKSG
jgi:putative membrane protein